MKTKKKVRKPESLTFENLYTVKGLYNDGKGNEFNVYISGEKKEVDKFRRYQERQRDDKGIFGIRATVTKDNSPVTATANKGNQLKEKRNAKVEFKSGRVKIGISRHKIVVRRPYQITYHIDPKIKTPLQPVALGANIQPVPDFEFEFDGPTADVNCIVQKGKVDFTLVEVGKGIADGPKTIEDKSSGKLIAKSNGAIQKWRVEAIGRMQGKESLFDLEYTKKIWIIKSKKTVSLKRKIRSTSTTTKKHSLRSVFLLYL